jgi:integrase
MPKKLRSRVYGRTRGGETRYYGDFRDLGGGQEALKVRGEKRATTDPEIAERLAADRVRELQAQRRDRVLFGIERQETLKSFAAHHLIMKAKAGSVGVQHMKATQQRLDTAILFFGPDRDIASIGVHHVQAFTNELLSRPRRGRPCPKCRGTRPALQGCAALCAACGHRWTVQGPTMTAANVRHYLVALSNLYRRAQSEGCVPPGFNPVAAMMDKPRPRRGESRWLEVPAAALLLESARTWRGGERPGAGMYAHMHPLLATFLLTGGRPREVFGLEVADINFDRKTVTFRPNRWRGLKTSTSHRSVRLWPQLEEVLRAYLRESQRAGGLLFPSVRLSAEQRKAKTRGKPVEGQTMIRDVRKSLDLIAERAGWKPGEIRPKMFRHTYCAARLQTLDQGAPVSIFTVARELGHGGDSLVREVYGHLGDVRHRAAVVEYRVEQHVAELTQRLALLREGAA